MELKITITCDELVKPSSLTPHHLRFYSLSFLDQLAPPIFMPFVFFYQDKTNLLNRERRTDQLKSSLSKILSLFYPLAGRIKNNTKIECNDEGVPFVEAKANCKISQILENPNFYNLNKFLSFENQEVSDVLLTVQLTFFDCGGLALGLGFCHKLCDALSALMFIKNWAAFCRGEETHDLALTTPCFDLAKLFPPCEIRDLNMATGIIKENIVTKRFVFLKPSLDSLKERFSENHEFPTTRVEALSGFIWSRFMASKSDDKIGKIYTVIHPVNLRRFTDLIPEKMFGNVMRFSVTVLERFTGINEDEERLSIVQKMREGIRKIDAEYVKKLQEDTRGHLEFLVKQATGFVNGEIVSFSFTSLCRFPVYEADFGWGKPSWVSSATMGYKNLVAFLDTKEGDGIEAWVNLEEKDMLRFEADEELLSYVSLNPSVFVFASCEHM